MSLAICLAAGIVLGFAIGVFSTDHVWRSHQRQENADAYARRWKAGLQAARADELNRTLANTEPADLRRWIPRDRGIREALEN